MHRRALLLHLALGTACGDAASAASGSTGGTVDPPTTSGTAADTTAGATTDTPTTAADPASSSGVDCPANLPPAIPELQEPLAGRIDVIPADLTIIASGFLDPDPGDAPGGVEAEIWRVKDGEPDERVWHAALDTIPPQLTLADGEYDDPDDTTLADWKDHVVRVRHRDEHGPCSAFSPWSVDRSFRTDDGSSILFAQDTILDFHLEIPPDSWQKINAQANPPGCVPFVRTYHTGTLRLGDQSFPGAGIKIKGGCGSSRDLNGKASFKVNIDWDNPDVIGCPGERRLLGQKHFTFNNGVQDDSASNERLGYPLYRELGVPAPRAASVRLFVNDELWGLYTHVETIDRRFLARWYPSNDGMLYEGTYWCDLIPENVPPIDDDAGCLTREFTPDPCTPPDEIQGDPQTYDLLRELVLAIDALPPGGFYPAITQLFDWDRFLTTWAIESVIDHWDNYAFTIKNNYRVYHDPGTGLWTLIATGIDQTFEKDQDPWGVEGVVAARCLAEPACEAAFAARLDEVNEALALSDLPGRATALFDQLSPAIMEDPRKEYSFNAFVDEHAALQSFLLSRPQQIRDKLTAHGF